LFLAHWAAFSARATSLSGSANSYDTHTTTYCTAESTFPAYSSNTNQSGATSATAIAGFSFATIYGEAICFDTSQTGKNHLKRYSCCTGHDSQRHDENAGSGTNSTGITLLSNKTNSTGRCQSCHASNTDC
jgi:hypothetical protein